MTPLAVSMGEPAGIGPDLILTLYAQRAMAPLPDFVVFGSADFLAARARRLDLDIAFTEDPTAFANALPVQDIAGDIHDRPGEPHAEAGHVVIGAIEEAVAATRSGRCRAVVTAPIHKGVLYQTGFRYPGHTEFLAALCADNGVEPLPVMMLAHEDLRTVPLTIHVPIRDVPGMIQRNLIVKTLRLMTRDLRSRFGIDRPRIAVAGLNPHAGEGGAIGREDMDIIAPAIAEAAAEGMDVAGPLPGDTLFYPPHWRQYDAVLAMYHDQALIPIKTVAFDAGVNVTLGLPIVRTSPDHGTAFDLAGTGKASTASMAAAIRMADRMSADSR
jgi:4-hydroxythreonine-4-phosphate dehydrogenase